MAPSGWAPADGGSAGPLEGNRPPIYAPQSRAAWSAFVATLARRYGSGESFWALHPELPYAPVRSWQIWNEVNLPYYWGGRPSPRGYADLLGLKRGALRDADPSAQVILAGLLLYSSAAPGAVSGFAFLKKLYRVNGVRSLFDVVAVHPYGLRLEE